MFLIFVVVMISNALIVKGFCYSTRKQNSSSWSEGFVVVGKFHLMPSKDLSNNKFFKPNIFFWEGGGVPSTQRICMYELTKKSSQKMGQIEFFFLLINSKEIHNPITLRASIHVC